MKHMKHYTAQDFGYKGDEYLMHVHTGIVCTAAEWAESACDWTDENETALEDSKVKLTFSSLVEVQEMNGEWAEIN